jgi:hypothetical protein
MKISKEYVLLIIVGLFILTYLLDSVTKPLTITPATPYHYLQPDIMGMFPFSTTSLFIKSIALYLTPVWLMSFISGHYIGKGSFLLVLASLMQLYALQDVVTKAAVIPLEWSLALAVAGMVLLVQALFFFIKGIFVHLRQNLTSARMEAAIEELQESKKDED